MNTKERIDLYKRGQEASFGSLLIDELIGKINTLRFCLEVHHAVDLEDDEYKASDLLTMTVRALNETDLE